jgi:hypothetical protein
MPNMSYCRFENTVREIEDCIYDAEDNDYNVKNIIANANKYERPYILRFFQLCRKVHEEFDDEKMKELEAFIRLRFKRTEANNLEVR